MGIMNRFSRRASGGNDDEVISTGYSKHSFELKLPRQASTL